VDSVEWCGVGLVVVTQSHSLHIMDGAWSSVMMTRGRMG
jgi:hypothetical protein